MEIVCVHGAGESSALWDPQVHTLANVRAVNLPGHGGRPGPGMSSVEAYSGWLLSELEYSKPMILAGHSMGGAVALQLALRDHPPVWLAGLILVGTGARLRVHPDILMLLDSDFEAAVELISEWATARGPHPAVRALSQRDMRLAGREVVRGDYLAANSFDVMDRLQRVHIPSLVLTGAQDRMTPVKYGRYLSEHIRDCRFTVVEGAGHLVTLERPPGVIAAMGEFRDAVGRMDPGGSAKT